MSTKSKKSFLLSIDTEGDNLWNNEEFGTITTNNSLFLDRFQNLCEEYSFKPTYLTNYEMAGDAAFVEFAYRKNLIGTCEIGMHLHAWNSPPLVPLEKRKSGKCGHPYLIEYSDDVMEEKIAFMTELLEKTFDKHPIVHRAGRWAMNECYYELLGKYNYIADCSVTPGLSWKNSNGFTENCCGPDYSQFGSNPYIVSNSRILELPVTVRENHRLVIHNKHSLKSIGGGIYKAIKGRGKIWLRPNGRNIEDLLYLVDAVYKSDVDYLMFMIHSSELMPGGSPYFKSQSDVEKLYKDLATLFQYVSEKFEGKTIGEYANENYSFYANI